MTCGATASAATLHRALVDVSAVFRREARSATATSDERAMARSSLIVASDWAGGAGDRAKPRPRLVAAVPPAPAADRAGGAQGPRHLAAHRQGVLPPRSTAGPTSPRSSSGCRALVRAARARPSTSCSTGPARTARSSCSRAPRRAGGDLLAERPHGQAGSAQRRSAHQPRAAGRALEILVDSHERYAWTFASQQATTVRRALPAGDYAVELDGQVVGRGRAQEPGRPGRAR